MQSHDLRRFALAFIAVFVVAGCQSGAIRDQDRTNWFLSEVRFDSAVAANAGVMPVFRRPTGTNFAGAPSASGSLKISDTGKATCIVRFDEPIVGLSGRQALQRYEVVNVNGSRSEDGKKIVGRFGSASDAPLGTVTELRLERESDLRLLARPYTGDRPLPYIFVFAADAAVERQVEIPFVE